MSNRLIHAILLLYPRRVRDAHGPEIVVLIDDLIAHEDVASRAPACAWRWTGWSNAWPRSPTVWTVVAVLAATTFGGLALSDFAAASAFQGVPRTARTVAPAAHTHRDSASPVPLAPHLTHGRAAPAHRT